MIIVSIFLVFITGLLILWISNQHKHINIFEQIGFSFGLALSLFVFELFLQGVFLGKLSLLFPILTFCLVLGIFIYKTVKKKNYLCDLLSSIKNNFLEFVKGFLELNIFKKIVIILLGIYVIFKIFLSFSINVSMPTYDEDAVSGWDLKTKVFMENKSLVLDKNNIEFLGSALERNIFAPLTDTYFLLGYDNFKLGLSNIISPLIYLVLTILLFGILLRKSDLFFAFITAYIFCSLPFVFIHSFGSYFNYISGYFLFVFAFYLSDQVLNINNNEEKGINTSILIPLAIFSFLDASIRNESIILMLAIFVLEIGLFYFYRRKDINLKKVYYVFIVLIGAVLAYITNIYINYISPETVGDISGNISGGVISRFFDNIGKSGVLTAPFSQSFLHTDYNLLYVLFTISFLYFVLKFKKLNELKSMFLSSILLLSIFSIILFINVESLGLISHFSFIRYPIAIIPFLVYVVGYTFYLILKGHNENKL